MSNRTKSYHTYRLVTCFFTQQYIGTIFPCYEIFFYGQNYISRIKVISPRRRALPTEARVVCQGSGPAKLRRFAKPNKKKNERGTWVGRAVLGSAMQATLPSGSGNARGSEFATRPCLPLTCCSYSLACFSDALVAFIWNSRASHLSSICIGGGWW